MAAAEARGVAVTGFAESIVSVSGIRPALERTIGWILERYRTGGWGARGSSKGRSGS